MAPTQPSLSARAGTPVSPVLRGASAGSLSIGTSAATSITFGSATNDSFTVVTDGSGDAEVVLPTGSIGTTEILNDTITGSDISDDNLDFSELSDSMTLDVATVITSTSLNGKSLDLNVTPDGSASTPIGFEITPTWGLDAPDQTLVGLNINPSTNSNTDSGDILYAIQVEAITGTAGTEGGLKNGSGWDKSIAAQNKIDTQGVFEAGSGNIELTNSTGNIQAGAYAAASIDGDDLASSVAGSGLVLLAGSPDQIDIDEIDVADGAGSTSNNSGLEFGGTGGAQIGLLQGCGDSEVLKWVESLSVWQCSSDVSAGTPTLENVSAALSEGSAQDSNENTVRWNWDFTGAADTEDSGLIVSESSASTAGNQDRKALVEITTLSGSVASPLQITSGSADAGDIWIDLDGSGDFEVRDAGVAFVQFLDDNTITLGKATSSSAVNIGNGSQGDIIKIGVGTTVGDSITIGNAVATTTVVIDTGTGGINFGDNANAKTIDIGGVTNSGTDKINIATNATAGDVIIIGNSSANTTLTLDGRFISVGTSTLARTVNIATGAATQTLTLGSQNSTSSSTLQAGTGDLFITSADVISMDAVGALSINSSGGVISIGNDAIAQNINLGTGGAARTITIGNTTGATALNLDTGTGGINFGDNANAKTIDIGGVTNSGTDRINIATNATAGDVIIIGNSSANTVLTLDGRFISIGPSTLARTVNIATGAAAQTLSLGSQNSTSSSTLQAGTGDLFVTSADVISMDAVGALSINSSGGVISIGNDAIAQNINLGTGGAARTIVIGNETGATSVLIDSGSGNIDIGTSTAKTISIGNATGATALNLDTGTGGKIGR